ncbi:response regulator transcription factor [Neorhizobium sp. Rsf11]|uniref:Response regulator transcription factor n=2 Tax=Neorhizobium TaxID=1525371 RepID=A0ABV0M8U2_9HYPH|nr:response regulator transcription factor [Neorhizobium petrolearium]MCC2614238.1 response regulator transcription factor [Neorhizobium petrolearium]WGI71745.1 response regulator transcription factor [Neorhizobium petrolearium]
MVENDGIYNSARLDKYDELRGKLRQDDIESPQLDLRCRTESGYITLIDRRTLERECLAHGLNCHHINRRVFTFSDLQEWQEARADLGIPSAVLFNAGNCAASNQQLVAEIAELVEAVAPAAVVVLSDNQDINTVLDIIGLGVRGYIPTSVSIDVCIQAISLAIAGGKFIPASSIVNIRDLLGVSSPRTMPAMKFTNRQSAIAQALRCGKANKDIASELNLCESTIKVHIRNIMKKLGATNRTEVACKIGDMVVCEH